MRRTRMGALLAWAAVAAIPGSARAAGSQEAQVKIFLRPDASGRCASTTPGVAEVFAGGTITWEIVRVKTATGVCRLDTKVVVDFPKDALGNVVVPADQPSATLAEEFTFASESAALDATLVGEDKARFESLKVRGVRRPGGLVRASPLFASRLTAKAIGAPGLYKYNVRVVGGATEDPPFKIIPPP